MAIRTQTATPSIITALALAALLIGCTSPQPIDSPTSEETTHSIFATEDEAFVAASRAYREYYRVSDAIFDDGGRGIERLRDVATEEQFEFEVPDYEDVRKRGLHSVGVTTIDTLSLQNYAPASPNGVEIVTLYACVDVSDIDVLDSHNNSILDAGRQVRLPFEPTFDYVDGRLLLSGGNPWSGKDFCN